MKKLPTHLLAALFAVTGAARGNLTVVTTLADYAAIAREIGGEHVEVTAMAKPTEDPHFVDARPSFVVKLRGADVLIEGGAELENGWLPPLLQTARNPKIGTGAPGRVAAAQGLNLLGVPAELNRAAGDIHAAGNPHFMVDPIVAKAVAARIARAFATADPAQATFYQANSAKFTATIDGKLQEWGNAMQPFRGRQVAAYHDDWLYFARRFGLDVAVFLEPKPGVPPSPAQLADVIGKIKAAHIKAILVEPFHNRKIAEKVAAATGATVVDVAQYPGALPGTDGYVAMIDALIARISAALK